MYVHAHESIRSVSFEYFGKWFAVSGGRFRYLLLIELYKNIARERKDLSKASRSDRMAAKNTDDLDSKEKCPVV